MPKTPLLPPQHMYRHLPFLLPPQPPFLILFLTEIKLKPTTLLSPFNPRSVSPSLFFCLLSVDPTLFHIHIYTLSSISSFPKLSKTYFLS